MSTNDPKPRLPEMNPYTGEPCISAIMENIRNGHTTYPENAGVTTSGKSAASATKVYLLRSQRDEGIEIHGIYSSKEKAIESFPFHEEKLDESNIEEIEVDPPHGNERYESFFCAYASTNGETWIADQPCRLTKSAAEALRPRMLCNKDGCSVMCFAPSKEEAAAKAAEYLLTLHPVWQVGRCIGSNKMLEVRHAHPSLVHDWSEIPGHKGYALHEDLETARKILIEHENTGRKIPGFVSAKDEAA